MLIVITCACDKCTFNSLRNSNSYFFISRSFELSPKPLKFEFLALGFELSRVRLCVTPNGAAYVNVGTKRNSVEWKKKKKLLRSPQRIMSVLLTTPRARIFLISTAAAAVVVAFFRYNNGMRIIIIPTLTPRRRIFFSPSRVRFTRRAASLITK